MYKVVCTVENTHLGGGGAPQIIKTGSYDDCEAERIRLQKATTPTDPADVSFGAVLGRSTFFTVEPAEDGDEVSQSQ